jgi:Protein of unknown function (DUF2612)
MENVAETELVQYAAGPRITALIAYVNQWYDPTALLDDWYSKMWNVATAVGYGLDVWGRIVGVTRVLQVAPTKYWGYAEATTLSADPYGQSPFYSGEPTTSNFALSDDAFRLLIMAKAALNITDGSIPAINAILMALFPNRGNAWVGDGLNMTLTYNFAFTPPLTQVEQAIVGQSGVLPRPPGVSASIVAH